MPWVLVRPLCWHVERAALLLFLFSSLFFNVQTVTGQTLVNGQVFSNGLAILDAPAPQSVQHAGSNMPIAIDISGDGKLSQAASIPGSGLATRFDFLDMYLVSSQNSINLTVSDGTNFLTQESGSTVKHLNWPIPTCLPSGSYNLTLYEGSHVNNDGYFSITPIPITIENTAVSGSCTNGTNDYLGQPQESSPPPPNPFLPTQPITITVGPSGIVFPSQSTVTVTARPSTVTVVMVSIGTTTYTSTLPGQTEVITTVVSATRTTTAVMESGTLGFFPVNSTPRRRAPEVPELALICVLASFLFFGIL
ncbi:hypothetical protein OE88DRAFT_1650953 [Heliocybe sulcata]|uniref:Uncharacterized protein n=1 Tax=Heliocybe sulcata TaxID=5364 RepID=A0A5C3NHC1_9AGAM|nr:hypothetical protein OE88DRAFT_1650953 [Heliocybe sulcata]